MRLMENAIYDLLQAEPYYAHFLLNSRIIYDPRHPKLPTAAVGVINGTPTFLFNTDWLGSKTRDEVVSVLKHEVLHLLLEHTSKIKDPGIEAKIMNIAQDCAINQHIKSLPEGCITLKSLEELVGHPLAAFETSMYYYGHLMTKAEEVRANGGPGTLDDHEYALEGDETNGEMRKVAVKSASDQAMRSSAGNLPDSLQKVLGTLNAESKLPWKQLLRNFIANSTSSMRVHTSKKSHRRMGLEHPGVKKKRILTLGVCVDSSGSVSDEHFIEFFNEIKEIAKNNTVYLVDADCEVQNVQVLTPKSKVEAKRYGNGGTAYQPAITECVKRGCNAIVYFGDMDTADTPKNPGIPVLWVSVGSEDRPGPFGAMIKL